MIFCIRPDEAMAKTSQIIRCRIRGELLTTTDGKTFWAAIIEADCCVASRIPNNRVPGLIDYYTRLGHIIRPDVLTDCEAWTDTECMLHVKADFDWLNDDVEVPDYAIIDAFIEQHG